MAHGRCAERPFVLLAQQSLFDPTRAPEGRHTAWAYCHVPNGSTVDMTQRIEDQIERFAPGFRDCVLARHVSTPAWLESRDANLVGGDISGGAMSVRQIFGSMRLRTGIFICALRRPLRGAECMGCAVTMRRGWRCGGRGGDSRFGIGGGISPSTSILLLIHLIELKGYVVCNS
jgi:phytoene dehydrogenase-like protein